MANPANSTVQNLLPVQAYFSVDGEFQTFIGQGEPFTATINPDQSGLNITNSTINSTTIGATTPSSGVFSSGQVLANPVGNTDLVNKLYVDSVASGLSWKQPFQVATTANIASLSGFPIIDTYQTVAGDRILVKNQTNAAQNGIYIASSGAWAYSADGDNWNEYVSAIGFVEYGSQLGSAWLCSAQSGGTLGVTAMNWSNFSVAGTYFAGTGLTLAAFTFSIANTGVTAATYGSASSVPVIAVNAQGQITSSTNTTIAIANTQVSGLGTMSTQAANSVAITGGTINGTAIGGTTAAAVTGTTITAGTQFTGAGTGLTGTATSLNIGGTASKATNIVGGSAGSLPYQSAADTTALLAAGTNGQVLTLASGVPSWVTPAATGVTSVSGTGTVSGITLSGTVTSTGSLTLGGTLDLSAPPAIGGTTANTVRGTTITATTGFVGTNYDASGSGGGSLRTNGGSACLQWGGGGGVNVTIDGPINMNGANSAIQINPTGTGTVSIAPAGALTVNPTTASTMNNVAIGGTTPLAGSFTDLSVTGTTSFDGSQGTAGQVLTSAGTGATPTWTTISAGLTVTDDTTTNATRYLTFTSATSGTISGINTASTELTWNPSTGVLSLAGSTGGINLPTGTTAQRPSATNAGEGLRYNTTTLAPEIYTGATNGWQQLVVSPYSYTLIYLIVAGGGGANTGGGGAGGMLTGTGILVSPGTAYTITIGAGGSGTSNGSNSTALTYTAIGGGYGGASPSPFNGNSGGSGGGGGQNGDATGGGGGSGTSGQGTAGGSGTATPGNRAGGGGGGAGAAGQNANARGTGYGGVGGNGLQSSITGTATYYAGGGGGYSGYYANVTAPGGLGGGGTGSASQSGGGTAGTANTGGGGGGAYNGGSGVVIISYLGNSQKGTGGTVTTYGSGASQYFVHTFTSSGTFTS
jgi:hypothetical protein